VIFVLKAMRMAMGERLMKVYLWILETNLALIIIFKTIQPRFKQKGFDLNLPR